MKTRILATAALCAFALAAACSNDPYSEGVFKVGYETLFKKKEGAPGALTQEQIVQTLGATDRPVMMVEIVDRDTQSLLIQIETNGPYRTFATATRQAMTTRQGILTGTRGLGGDLMSTEHDALLDILKRRGTGAVTYVQRFITPEDVTKEIRYRCEVEPDSSVDVARGLVRAVGTEMLAACQAEDGKPFVDYYVVDNAGVVASRQWLGKDIGYVSMHLLRR